MEAFLIYLFKSSALLSIFYLAYYLLLRKDTFFTINRHFLLGGIIISLLLPFVEFTTIKFIEEPNFSFVETTVSGEATKALISINWWLVAILLYSFGTLVFAIRFIIQLISLKKLITDTPIKIQGNYVLIEVKDDVAPFSFFNYIVYNPNLHTPEELDMILKHEKIHVLQYHTIDLLVVNLLRIFQWINPFVWFYKKSLEQNLEFIADRETINQVPSKKEYQLTLVKVSSNNYAAIANNFYQSLIKKRIVMLNKKTSQNSQLWKITLILPCLSLFLWSFNTKEIVKIKDRNTVNSNTTDKLIFQEQGTKVVQTIINKNSSKKDLEKIKKTFKDEFNIDVKFSDIKRNNEDEITAIKVAITGLKSNANYALSNDKPIDAFSISYDDSSNQINIGQSSSNHDFIWVNKKGSGKNHIVKIHQDHDDDTKHEFIFASGGKNKIIHGGSENVFEMHSDDDKTYAFITGTDGKEPLFYIDGKESTKEEVEKLDSDQIETMNVLKGKSAIKKYGKKAKNGVIEITTKSN